MFDLTLDNFSFHSINMPDEDLRIINEARIQRKKDQIEAEGTVAKMDIESAVRARMREHQFCNFRQVKMSSPTLLEVMKFENFP